MKQEMVLIAEDDALLRNALAEKFTYEGFKVHTARNGEETLVKAFTLHPALILLDILMPKLDGRAVLRELREDAWGAKVKILLLTNMVEAQLLAEENPYRSDGCLIKADTKIRDVVASVREHLNLPSSIDRLPEYRCTCGKLLFKGTLLFSTLEIKCKRCGTIRRIDTANQELG